MNDPVYRIALTLIPNIGDVLIRNLISYCGSEEKIFKSTKEKLLKIPGVGEVIAQSIKSFNDFRRAEDELKFVEKHNIQMLFFTDTNYPARLKQYNDSPVLLYYKGTTDLNFKTGVAIVGTRNATDYGKSVTEKLVQELAPYKPVIISGLAYGIDIHAHRDALNNKLETIAVLGHGLHTIYPAQHRSAAQKIVEQGGLLTEFMSSSSFDKENFPKRNRIVAALCDCLIVVESGIKGGALITAHLAGEYNKDVFAFPGRATDPMSEGCNGFIKLNKATLIENGNDVARMMGWEENALKKIPQRELIFDYTEEEKPIVEYLKENKVVDIDNITLNIKMSNGQIANALLGLELKGAVIALPGKRYKLN